ncbi:hypothetical protein [Actinoplanes sp. NPDC051411]|uniref:hypothetical protein n=1 Tax=Actinoplanes sp. NPDC051411 TaxID=3155522 RepID=UPI0034388E4E
MSSPKDLEQRVSAVEAEVGVAREEAAAARALASGADRDVADLRAELRGHGRVLTALRETQLEMQHEFRETTTRHYAEHKADVAEMKAGMVQIVRMLESLGGENRGGRA